MDPRLRGDDGFMRWPIFRIPLFSTTWASVIFRQYAPAPPERAGLGRP